MPDLTRPGMPAALGIRTPGKQFLAIGRRSGPEEVRVPVRTPGFRLLYPGNLGIRVAQDSRNLNVHFPSLDMACILAT